MFGFLWTILTLFLWHVSDVIFMSSSRDVNIVQRRDVNDDKFEASERWKRTLWKNFWGETKTTKNDVCYFFTFGRQKRSPTQAHNMMESLPREFPLSLLFKRFLSPSLSLFYHFFSPVFAAELLSPNLTLPLPLSLLFQIPMWRFCLWVLASGLRLSQVQLAARPRRRQKFKDRWYFQECMWSVWKITRPVNPEAFTSPRATSLKVRLNWVCHTHLVS